MRYFLAVASVVFLGMITVIYVGWDSIADLASEPPLESGRELGRISYHAAKCSEADLVTGTRTSMEDVEKIAEDFHADMKTAFKAGVEEARDMNMDYTETFCAEITNSVSQAQAG